LRVEADRLKLVAAIGTGPASMPIDLATGRGAIELLCPACRDELAVWFEGRKATKAHDMLEAIG